MGLIYHGVCYLSILLSICPIIYPQSLIFKCCWPMFDTRCYVCQLIRTQKGKTAPVFEKNQA